MPIYEYVCGACNHRFEQWQSIKEAPVRVCPSCNAERAERIISATSFALKGSGWYATDYKKSSSSSSSSNSG